MKHAFQTLMLAVFAFSFISGASAQSKITNESAIQAVQAVIAFHKANGKEKALAEANKPDSKFRKGDLYVFAYSGTGVNLAHVNSKMVGKNLIDMKDADGVAINKEFIKIAKSKDGKGWITAKETNPASKMIEPKESYVEKYEDVYWMCGYYLP